MYVSADIMLSKAPESNQFHDPAFFYLRGTRLERLVQSTIRLYEPQFQIFLIVFWQS